MFCNLFPFIVLKADLSKNKKERRVVTNWNSRRVSTFYPRYGEGRDRIEAVKSLRPTMFQEIIPRYNLSATDTRDDGVGPMFEEISYVPNIYRRKKRTIRPTVKSRSPKRRKKIRIDFSI